MKAVLRNGERFAPLVLGIGALVAVGFSVSRMGAAGSILGAGSAAEIVAGLPQQILAAMDQMLFGGVLLGFAAGLFVAGLVVAIARLMARSVI